MNTSEYLFSPLTLCVPSKFFPTTKDVVYTSLMHSKCMYSGCLQGTRRTYVYVLGTQRVKLIVHSYWITYFTGVSNFLYVDDVLLLISTWSCFHQRLNFNFSGEEKTNFKHPISQKEVARNPNHGQTVPTK